MSQLDQMTQQNAALVEESTAASESLREQALHLSSAVSQFKLQDGGAPAPSVFSAAAAVPFAPAVAQATRRPALRIR